MSDWNNFLMWLMTGGFLLVTLAIAINWITEAYLNYQWQQLEMTAAVMNIELSQRTKDIDEDDDSARW